MYETNYHRPTSTADAVAARNGAEEATYLAGGQTLIPTMKQRLAAPSDLVDLRHVPDLKGVCEDGDLIIIGAMTTHSEVNENDLVTSHVPVLADMAGRIGDPHVRAMGTIGGSVANNDPSADYPAALLGLGASIRTDKREIAAADFFEGMFATALDEGEMIISIAVPKTAHAGWSKFRNPASRYAMAGVLVAKTADGVRVAVTGAGSDGVFRHTAMEQALDADFSADALEGVDTPADDLLTDIHGSAAYRANLVNVMAKRAVANAQG
ncbi:MAG: xanthine dehydrogenase family protein subunit M [Pseudomonadota bacterium]